MVGEERHLFSKQNARYALAVLFVATVYFYYRSLHKRRDDDDDDEDVYLSRARAASLQSLSSLDFGRPNPRNRDANMTVATKYETNVVALKPPKKNSPKSIEEIRKLKNPFYNLINSFDSSMLDIGPDGSNSSLSSISSSSSSDGGSNSNLDRTFDLSSNILETSHLVATHTASSRELNFREISHKKLLRVVSFNILAECYAHSVQYPYCDPLQLKWNHRSEKILDWLEAQNAALMALQEVDHPDAFRNRFCAPKPSQQSQDDAVETKVFEQDEQKKDANDANDANDASETNEMNETKSGKYEMYYLQRTRKKQDGIALLWDREKFELFVGDGSDGNDERNDESDVGFNIELNELADACLTENLQNHYRKDNVGCYVILRSKKHPNQVIFFGNCHLYYHPKKADVRLRQSAYIANILQQHAAALLEEHKGENLRVSIILCGDFNTLPTDLTYEFLTNPEYVMEAQGNQELKLILDPSLNKVARWCRALGVDTTFYPGANMDKTDKSDKKDKKEIKDKTLSNEAMEPSASNDSSEPSTPTGAADVEEDESKTGSLDKDTSVEEPSNASNSHTTQVSQVSLSSIAEGPQEATDAAVGDDADEIADDGNDANDVDEADAAQSGVKKQLTPKERRKLKRAKKVKNSSHGKINIQELFDTAREQNRYLVTKSKNLCARRDCPAHLLLKSNDGTTNLKRIIKYFGIAYDEDCVYTRCTLCNGMFAQIMRAEIASHPMIPDGLRSGVDEDGPKLTFYQCLDCKQVYWWGRKTETESQRFQGIFDVVEKELNEESKKQDEMLLKHLNNDAKGNESNLSTMERRRYLQLVPNLQKYFWKDITFINPFAEGLKSACREHSMLDSEPEFTNKTSSFSGTLDYIFFGDVKGKDGVKEGKGKARQRDNLICRAGRVCLPSGDRGQGPYPNEHWCSDHLPVVAMFEFKR